MVCRTQHAVFNYTEHALGGSIMARHLGFPVGEAGPRAGVPDRIFGPQQRIGIGNGPAPNRAAMENGDMPEPLNAEKSTKTERWTPEPPPQVPIGARQSLRRPAAPHLHNCHAVAFFGEAMRADAASKAGADHDEVEIVSEALPSDAFHTLDSDLVYSEIRYAQTQLCARG